MSCRGLGSLWPPPPGAKTEEGSLSETHTRRLLEQQFPSLLKVIALQEGLSYPRHRKEPRRPAGARHTRRKTTREGSVSLPDGHREAEGPRSPGPPRRARLPRTADAPPTQTQVRDSPYQVSVVQSIPRTALAVLQHCPFPVFRLVDRLKSTSKKINISEKAHGTLPTSSYKTPHRIGKVEDNRAQPLSMAFRKLHVSQNERK